MKYDAGAKAITWKAVAILARQSPMLFAVPILMFLGALFSFTYLGSLWVKALILFGGAMSLANVMLISFQQDLRNWTFVCRLPFSPKELVVGNTRFLWGVLVILSWIFLGVVWGRGGIPSVEVLPLVGFLVVATYLMMQLAILTAVVQTRSRVDLKLTVFGLGMGMFAVLGGIAALLLHLGVPAWSAWVVVSVLGIPIAWVWKRWVIQEVQYLMERPWENKWNR